MFKLALKLMFKPSIDLFLAVATVISLCIGLSISVYSCTTTTIHSNEEYAKTRVELEARTAQLKAQMHDISLQENTHE